MPTQYFQNLPKIYYDLESDAPPYSPIVVTNVLARAKIRDAVLKNLFVYYTYQIQDGDSPESIAMKYYGTPQRHWIILFANNIIDPFYDWPLTYFNFTNFIISKYGSIATALATVDHYELQTISTDSATQSQTTKIDVIDFHTYSNTSPSATTVQNLSNGTTVTKVITTNSIDCYTNELNINEAKRNIKIIDSSYASQIEKELNDIFG